MLKPNDEYGGKGIVLGWDVDDDDVGARRCADRARGAVHRAASASRCPPSRIRAWSTDACSSCDRMVDTAPFVCDGDYVDGCLTRLSTAALLNVTAGGGIDRPDLRRRVVVRHQGEAP